MNPAGLTGQVAVVTGAASGLGRGSALRLAAEGCSVIAVDIDEPGLTTLSQARAESDGEILTVTADVSDPAQVDAYIKAGVTQFGRIDLHHLNAGIFGTFAPLPDLAVEEFDRVQAVNVRGQFLGLRAAFRRYREQRSSGAVVLTASIASLTGSADLIAYQTSKHATLGLVRGGAMFGGPLGIRVNGVAPGIVPTELFAAAAGESGGKNDMRHRASTTPLRRAGTPQDIAGVTAFLLSDDAAYVTGQIVSADGGATIVNTVRPSGGAGAWSTDELDFATYGEWLQKEEVSREQ
ncbi:MAG TPA: SDR family NAD(P)-dependent oxidoreductase [Solirubrobacteraceae bacterium]|jgi:NAD(P)-dependent dehydrogenase (short-subunit alcohol dehydrogenase family)|nr:SDR family NAD(P)-dependent oxidoreductase [Solirubrobacteraceae bacterium]